MDVPATAILIISLVITKGLAMWKSNRTIGLMLDNEFNSWPLSEVVDEIKHAYRRRTMQQGHQIEVKWVILTSTNPTYARRKMYAMINDGILALVSALRCSQRWTVSSMADQFQIPHLSIDLDLCPRSEHEFTLHQTSQYETMISGLVDIVKAAGWKQIQLTFNKIVDSITRQQFLVKLSLAGIRAALSKQTTHTNITGGNIVLMVENARKNTHQTKDSSMMLTNTVFVQELTPETIRSLHKTYQNINMLAVQINAVSSCTWLDMGTDNREMLLESQVSQAVLLFYAIFKTTAQTDLNVHNGTVRAPKNEQSLKGGRELFKQLKEACDSGESNICYRLQKPLRYNLCFIPAGSVEGIIHLGHWTEDKGIKITTAPSNITNILFRSKMTDFGGISLRVVVHGANIPFSRRVDSETDNNRYHGMTIDIIDELASQLNFRYTLTGPPDGQFGVRYSNGTVSGMVGMVARREADIGANPFTVNTERSEVVDFTTAFMHDSLGILTSKEKKAPGLFQVFKPFKPNTWLAIFATVLAAFVAFVSISLKSPTRTNDNTKQHSERSVRENVFLIISSYFGQGPTFYPTSGSARCFLAFWFVFTLLTMAMYTAVLAAVLTVSTPVKHIDTLEDLAHREDMGILIAQGAASWSLFTHSEQPLYKKIGSRMEAVNSSVIPFDLIKQGKFCYITDREVLEYLAFQSCGELRVASNRIHGIPLAFIISKNSPYKAAIDRSLQHMVESGIILTIRRKWIKPRTDCSSKYQNEENVKFGLDTLGGVFIIYLAVTFVSVIAFLVEFFQGRYTRKSYSLRE